MEYVESKKYKKNKMDFTYDNISNLNSVLHRNRPFSCVRTLDEYDYVIVRNLASKKLGGVPISFIYEKKLIICQWYTTVLILICPLPMMKKLLLISLQLVAMYCFYQNFEDIDILLLTHYHFIISLTLNRKNWMKIWSSVV